MGRYLGWKAHHSKTTGTFSMFYVMILSSRTLKRHLTKWWKITSSRKRSIPTRERTWMNSATSMYISLPPSRFVKLARIVGWRGQKVLWRIQACSPDIWTHLTTIERRNSQNWRRSEKGTSLDTLSASQEANSSTRWLVPATAALWSVCYTTIHILSKDDLLMCDFLHYVLSWTAKSC